MLLNIVFVLVIIFFTFASNPPGNALLASKIFVLKGFSIATLLTFTYFNNLYLAPKFITTRRYGYYFLFAGIALLLYAILFTTVILGAIHYYPGINLYEIVFLSVPLKLNWTLKGVLLASLGYILTFAMWTFIMTMAWMMHNFTRQQKAMMLMQQKQIETELGFLKTQINPHFLFNTLNNLYALALKKSDMAPDAIIKLSSILRYLLYESNTPTVSFVKEKEIMQAYIDLELLRLTDKSNLHFNIEADNPYELPPLLWLPILENVFKHGTRTISDTNHVEYHFEIKSNKLTIYSKNTDKLLVKNNDKESGIGLINLRKRLEIMYPNKHYIKSHQENNNYILEVNINL